MAAKPPANPEEQAISQWLDSRLNQINAAFAQNAGTSFCKRPFETRMSEWLIPKISNKKTFSSFSDFISDYSSNQLMHADVLFASQQPELARTWFWRDAEGNDVLKNINLKENDYLYLSLQKAAATNKSKTKEELHNSLKHHYEDHNKLIAEWIEKYAKEFIEQQARLTANLPKDSITVINLNKRVNAISEKLKHFHDNINSPQYLWFSTPSSQDSQYQALYYQELLNQLYSTKKDTWYIDRSQYDRCFILGRDQEGNESKIINGQVVQNLWQSLFNSSGISTISKEEKPEIETNAAVSAFRQINDKKYIDFVTSIRKLEAKANGIIKQYEVANEFVSSYKTYEDCTRLTSSLPSNLGITDYTELIQSNLVTFINEAFEGDKKDKLLALATWPDSDIPKLKSDPIFCTLLYNELLWLLNDAFQSQFSDSDASNDDDEKKVKAKTANSEIKAASEDQIDKMFWILLWTKADKGKVHRLKEQLASKHKVKDQAKHIKDFEDSEKALQGVRNEHERLKALQERTQNPKEKEVVLNQMRHNALKAVQIKEIWFWLEDDQASQNISLAAQLAKVPKDWAETVTHIEWINWSHVKLWWKAIDDHFNEKIKAWSKYKAHKMLAEMAEAVGQDELAQEQFSKCDSEYSKMVKDHKTTLEGKSSDDLFHLLMEWSHHRLPNYEFQAIITILGDKWMFSIDNIHFIWALNEELKYYSPALIMSYDEYKDLTNEQKLEWLSKTFPKVFDGDDDLLQTILDNASSKFTKKASEKKSTINTLRSAVWDKLSKMYNSYLDLLEKPDNKNMMTPENQIKIWRKIRIDDDPTIDPYFFEEACFWWLLNTSVGDSFELFLMVYYIIRWISIWLIPPERANQFDIKNIGNKVPVLHRLKFASLEDIRAMDLELTSNWKEINPLTEEGKRRIMQFFENFKRVPWNHARLDKVLWEGASIDQDLYAICWDHLAYSFIDVNLFDRAWGQIKSSGSKYWNIMASYSTHLHYFWKTIDGKQIEPEELVEDMAAMVSLSSAMKGFMCMDAVLVTWTYKKAAMKWDQSFLRSAPSQSSGGVTIGQHADSVRWIMEEVLVKEGVSPAMFKQIYQSKNTSTYFGSGGWPYSNEFDQVFDPESASWKENLKVLIRVIQKYQNLWAIPTHFSAPSNPMLLRTKR